MLRNEDKMRTEGKKEVCEEERVEGECRKEGGKKKKKRVCRATSI